MAQRNLKRVPLDEIAIRLKRTCGQAESLIAELDSRALAVPKDMDLERIRTCVGRWRTASDDALATRREYRKILKEMFGESYYVELFIKHVLSLDRAR